MQVEFLQIDHSSKCGNNPIVINIGFTETSEGELFQTDDRRLERQTPKSIDARRLVVLSYGDDDCTDRQWFHTPNIQEFDN